MLDASGPAADAPTVSNSMRKHVFQWPLQWQTGLMWRPQTEICIEERTSEFWINISPSNSLNWNICQCLGPLSEIHDIQASVCPNWHTWSCFECPHQCECEELTDVCCRRHTNYQSSVSRIIYAKSRRPQGAKQTRVVRVCDVDNNFDHVNLITDVLPELTMCHFSAVSLSQWPRRENPAAHFMNVLSSQSLYDGVQTSKFAASPRRHRSSKTQVFNNFWSSRCWDCSDINSFGWNL